MTTKVPTAMLDADTASQVELDTVSAAVTAEVSARTTLAARVTTLEIAGRVVQVVNTQTGAVATGTTVLPQDNTIPQNTEGDEYMSLAITPKSATNKLKIDVVCMLSSSISGDHSLTAALFQDTTANALAAGVLSATPAGMEDMLCFTHYMTAGTTSSTTFKVRAGANTSGTTTFNGAGGVRMLGGVMASSITITEISV